MRFKFQTLIRWSRGRFAEGYERDVLFPPTEPNRQRAIIREARFLLGGHVLLALISLVTGQWMLTLLITLANFYGDWLLFLCNNTQHVGLMGQRARLPSLYPYVLS